MITVDATRQLLLVGSSQQQGNEALPFHQSGSAKPAVKPFAALFGLRAQQGREAGDQFVDNVPNQPTEHGGNQRPLLVGQARAVIEEEIGHGYAEPVASHAGARGIDRAVGC
jgi:hypothetical protein